MPHVLLSRFQAIAQRQRHCIQLKMQSFRVRHRSRPAGVGKPTQGCCPRRQHKLSLLTPAGVGAVLDVHTGEGGSRAWAHGLSTVLFSCIPSLDDHDSQFETLSSIIARYPMWTVMHRQPDQRLLQTLFPASSNDRTCCSRFVATFTYLSIS